MKEPTEKLDRLAYEVIGAAIEVHKELGPGFLESVYEEALCVELAFRQIGFRRQHPVSVSYKGRGVGEGRLDLLVENLLAVENDAHSVAAPPDDQTGGGESLTPLRCGNHATATGY